MVKAKKADAKLARTTTKGGGRQTKNNPFEIRTNRKKHDILGRKLKHERGLPGISRSKAIKKRQKTLLVEYKQKNKANLFIDRRFGEYDETMSLEEKMMKRFTMERKHQHESQSKYRLEDEELTHLGQSLGEINKFEDVQLSDDDDDYNDINDGAEDVKELHFGGFLTKKNPDGKPSDSNEDKPRSRKEIMEEVVAKAKMKKYERQKVKEEAVAMTNKLNQDWRSVMKLLPQKACNRLESEKELAKEEQERSEKLEGLNSHETSSSKADDYDVIVRQLAFEAKATDDDDVDDDDDNNDEDDDDDDSNCEAESGKEDDASDVESDVSNDEMETDQTRSSPVKQQEKRKSSGAKYLYLAFKIRSEVEETKRELPFTFTAPESYSEFKQLVKDWSYKDQLTIIERIKTCNNPNVTPQNKPKMETFFAILLAYFSELSTMGSEEMKLVDKLSRQLFDIAQYSPVNSAKHMQQIVKDIQERFAENRDRRGGKGMFPDLSELLNLRVVSMLFSASDFKHVVCTPAILLLSQVLAQVGNLVRLESYATGNTSLSVFLLQSQTTSSLTFIEFSQRSLSQNVEFLQQVEYFIRSSGLVVKPLPITKTLGEVTEEESMKDEIRVNTLSHCLSLLSKFLDLYQDLLASFEIFAPVKEHLLRLPIGLYPHSVKELHTSLLSRIKELYDKSLRRRHLTLQTRKPQAIKIYEPKFKEHYEIRHGRRGGNKVANDKQKLRYKYKKEFKLKAVDENSITTAFFCGCIMFLKQVEYFIRCSGLVVKPLPITKTLGEVTEEESTKDAVRVNTLSHCLSLLSKFLDLYQDLLASFEIFAPVKEHLLRLPIGLYPHSVKELHTSLLSRIKELYDKSLRRRHLTLQTRKPQAIKIYEPKFKEHYEIRHGRRGGNKVANDKQKLRYKYKKEFKGAIREIRKDNQFLAKQKLKEQLERDTERMRKVKEIEHLLSSQQGEVNEMKRIKRKLGKIP
ncbi:PREDICTED: nucleolar protein 14-like [Acropora digitifera]|uniref:nucleolar protein 14-like n=1 Tax=Acropora digitifera TaxID=70779 RepID=UPI00077AB653|nr:PREDICTED: nucleolar protein 14-like [Acropora digitifera]